MEGNQDTEAYRQSYLQDKSEILGYSESEHIGGLETRYLDGRAPAKRAKAEFISEKKMNDTLINVNGVIVMAWYQGYAKQLEKPSSSQREIHWSKVGSIRGLVEELT